MRGRNAVAGLAWADGRLWNELVTEPAGYAFDGVFPALADASGHSDQTVAGLFQFKEPTAMLAGTAA